MQVNNIQSNNPTFGMALHMKDIKVFKNVLGNNVAKNLEAARPELEEMAKDVDIFIKPRRFADNPFMPAEYIGIFVQKKNITLKDKIMRFFNRRPPYKTDDILDPQLYTTKEDIIKQTKNLKNQLLNWIAK